ncbi:MAG: efflux RND transporter periplasmic adaptor subunit [Nitratireductor sp.]|nr:efflux RND transporter periplasmic adaptor subunit [Nitratireductor sp.]
MNLLKQISLIVAVIVIAAVLWLRFDATASSLALRAGLPPQLVAFVSGNDGATTASTEGSRGSGQGAGKGGGKAGGGWPGGDQATLVVTATAGEAAINDRVSAIGDGEALRSVAIVPLSSGTIASVEIEAGAQVAAGDVLFRLDSQAQAIARDRAALAVRIARDKVERNRKLVESRTVTAVQLTEAENELANAELALRDAELTLERRSVIAPIAGVVGLVPVEIGDYVTTDTQLATIDDRSAILLDFYVPERFAALVAVGQKIDAEAIALPDAPVAGEITAIASRIDRASRTFQIRARLDNAEDRLRPGMSFKVRLAFSGDSYAAVPPLAIQWSSDGAYLWKSVDDKAMRVPVRIIQRNSDTVLVSGAVAKGDTVITEGLQSLRPGMAVRSASEEAAQPQPPKQGAPESS